jgi:hypothetical protein
MGMAIIMPLYLGTSLIKKQYNINDRANTVSDMIHDTEYSITTIYMIITIRAAFRDIIEETSDSNRTGMNPVRPLLNPNILLRRIYEINTRVNFIKGSSIISKR